MTERLHLLENSPKLTKVLKLSWYPATRSVLNNTPQKHSLFKNKLLNLITYIKKINNLKIDPDLNNFYI